MIMVSACLKGINCKYTGGHNLCDFLDSYIASRPYFLVCPETMGGLPTPRPPAEIQGGDGNHVLDGRARVITSQGVDVTGAYVNGARACLELALLNGVSVAILKARSPSCGCSHIYNGSFTGRLVAGDGVTAALLKRNGIKVLTEEELMEDGYTI